MFSAAKEHQLWQSLVPVIVMEGFVVKVRRAAAGGESRHSPVDVEIKIPHSYNTV